MEITVLSTLVNSLAFLLSTVIEWCDIIPRRHYHALIKGNRARSANALNGKKEKMLLRWGENEFDKRELGLDV